MIPLYLLLFWASPVDAKDAKDYKETVEAQPLPDLPLPKVPVFVFVPHISE
jgi:hypothetical protein